MRATLSPYVERGRIRNGLFESGEFEASGVFQLADSTGRLFVIVVSAIDQWDRVSVSTSGRLATWSEMRWVKDLFFEPFEIVLQIHPPALYEPRESHLDLWCRRGNQPPGPPLGY